MKKLLLVALLLPCLVTAQDTIKIPVKIAKQIAVELSECDSIVDILAAVDTELSTTKDIVTQKETLLNNAAVRITSLSNEVLIEREQKETYKTLYAVKKKDYEILSEHHRRHKARRNFLDITIGAAAAIVIYLLAR